MTCEHLSFQGTWRDYQERVLKELDRHLHDNHLHVVAAPGSGKTILGLEVMRRIGKPSIILAPTITIRNQWIERLLSMFMPDQQPQPDWISKDVKNPKWLTVITYQALHAAFSGEEEIEEEVLEAEEEAEDKPKVRTSKATDVTALLATQKVSTIVLDEAHHLRNAWWKALTRLKAGLGASTIVSLTATPPYDVDYTEWQKYEELCGPIDAEISVPELVRRGDLCPHQDYVYFSLPTTMETEKLHQFKGDIAKFLNALKTNRAFLDAFYLHPWVSNTKEHVGDILGEPTFFSSIIIFMNAVGIKTPRYALDILGVGNSEIPDLTPQWLERLLTGVLYTHAEHFADSEETLDAIRKELKRIGAIERRKVILDNTKEIQKLLASSLGKLDSIVSITRREVKHLGDNLRMVILADYIRKTELPSHAQDVRPIDKIGVVPIFEYLRRANIQGIKPGLLTGSLIFIPQEAKPILENAATKRRLDLSHIHFSALAHDAHFLRVEITGEQRQSIVHLITEVFNAGGITVLVGTQALLGEGWDAPSINTLILASYIGSYMLSNQMRGRAIRRDPNRPDKVANIWHLVAIDIETLEEKLKYHFTGQTKRQKLFDPFDEIKEDIGNDVRILRRRFRAFEGLSYEHPVVIENGFKRLGLAEAKWHEAGISQLNQSMLNRAEAREQLPKLWDEALQGSTPKPEMREKIESNYAPTGLAFADTIKYMAMNALIMGAHFGAYVFSRKHSSTQFFIMLMLGLGIATIVALPKLLKALYLLIRNGSLEKSMKQVGWSVLETLQHMELVKTAPHNLRIETLQDTLGVVYCRLDGATTIEKRHFLEAMQEVLGPTDNPRYLLVRQSELGRLLRVDYHPVPTIFGQNKKTAEFFAKRWERRVGSIKLVYTRSVEGRISLLQARTKSLASAFQKKTDRLHIWE